MHADQQDTIKLKEHLALHMDQTSGFQESFSHQAISNALRTTSEDSSVWVLSKCSTIRLDPDPHFQVPLIRRHADLNVKLRW